MKLMNISKKYLVGGAVVALSVPAFADAAPTSIDVTSVTTVIAQGAAAIAAIGIAILAIYALAKSFKLVQKAF
ncbi:major capsid protein [Chromobacterium amazonense]|uniref:major capsid protein n=1 Tax=Chromobacterium amazonense TaxID=1382803 RepID=UPI00237EC197|nr:major capsid protein [Chromobacterium amazonense]MDE1716313.1 major capsid protein [Chromobacterium amazonense]